MKIESSGSVGNCNPSKKTMVRNRKREVEIKREKGGGVFKHLMKGRKYKGKERVQGGGEEGIFGRREG